MSFTMIPRRITAPEGAALALTAAAAQANAIIANPTRLTSMMPPRPARLSSFSLHAVGPILRKQFRGRWSAGPDWNVLSVQPFFSRGGGSARMLFFRFDHYCITG